MKHFFILLITLVTVASTGFSQDKTGTKSKARNTHQDHLLVDFGWETFNTKPPGLEFEWYNNGVNIQLFYDQLFGQSGFSGAIGIGFSTQSYYSNRQIRRDTTLGFGDYSTWKIPDYVPYQKNKVSTSWIEVPIEFRFRTKLDDMGYRWKFSVGAKLGFLLDTHDKIVDDRNIKYKTYYFPDMNTLRGGIIARIGYGKVNFSGFFSLTEFFIPGRGPEMKQIGIAISLVPF